MPIYIRTGVLFSHLSRSLTTAPNGAVGISTSPGVAKNPGNSETSESYKDVIYEDLGKVATMTLNRPKLLNAVNLGMASSIYSAISKFAEEKKSLIIAKGSGDKAFSAGGDLVAMAHSGKSKSTDHRELCRVSYRVFYAISILPIPYCALMNGLTMGGGAGISVHGRYRVGTEKSVFAMPETEVGYFPNVGATYFLTRLKGKLGYYMGLTSNGLRGSDIYHAGITTHAVDTENYRKLQSELLSLPLNTSLEEVEDCLNQFTKEAKFIQNKPLSFTPHMDLIDECFSAPTVEGIFENLSKSNDPFAQATLEKLSKLSPVALKVTKKALDEGSTKSLADCFQMEYRLSVRMCESHDFFEGVRARIIDKDLKPNWKPNRLEDCTDEYVDSFFAPLLSYDQLNLHEVHEVMKHFD